MTTRSTLPAFSNGAKAQEFVARQKHSWIYATTIFLSAFLLFQVQLIVGKFFLPWFGGTPAMWTTCMFFFQTLLVGGYAYSHSLSYHNSLRKQGTVHVTMLGIVVSLSAVLAFKWHSPLLPSADWRPSGADNPVSKLILLLAISAGFSYFALATTGPLLQRWFATRYRGSSPYRLYALSNFGSFLGLLSYPIAVEPWLTLRVQAQLWFVGFCVFCVACSCCALQMRNAVEKTEIAPDKPSENESVPGRVELGKVAFWFSCAATGSLLFLATTNQICQNIAVVPLLWILPLAIYLLTMTISFDHPRFYSRRIFHPLLAGAMILAIFLLSGGVLTRLVGQIACYACILFVACMVCHGELARSKPAPRFLTLFYLVISLGGAAAGVFVVLVAPKMLTTFFEYPVALWLATLLMLVAVIRDREYWVYKNRFGVLLIAFGAASLPGAITLVIHGRLEMNYLFLLLIVLLAVIFMGRNGSAKFSGSKVWAAVLFSSATLLLLAVIFILGSKMQSQGAAMSLRNFYGVLTVRELSKSEPEWQAFKLSHGLISHGFQFRSRLKSRLPTSYYGPQSGVGRAIALLRARGSGIQPKELRFGVIGLGVGTLAAYAHPDDNVRFYEINPDVVNIARNRAYFSYLADCPAEVEIVPGDARLSMERELGHGRSQHFDLLAVDAFSSDAPPVHLLTKQAFQVYVAELAPHGVIAVNITNSYIDLRPVVRAIAANLSLSSAFLHSDGDGRIDLYSDWVLVSRDPLPFEDADDGRTLSDETYPWTDDYSNLLRVLR